MILYARIPLAVEGIKIFVSENKKEAGRVYLYFLRNDLHRAPLCYVEDLYVHEEYRGKGIGAQLIKSAVHFARKKKCYKIIAASRYGRDKVHKLYTDAGFTDHGKEFRMDLV